MSTSMGLTLARLAEAKRLPSQFLASLGVRDHLGGIAIDYLDDAGEPLATKRRTNVVARNGSFWPAGLPLAAYGLWRLHDARKAGFVILVEGESDCWALWHHGLPALGLPGCDTARLLTAEMLSGLETVYVHREPDRGGARFVGNVAVRLRELRFAGKACEIMLPDRIKDPADLHCVEPERFNQWIEQAIVSAKGIPLGTGKSKSSDEPPPAPVVLRLEGLQAEPTRWLWAQRIPRGAVTVLEGDPGLGKSTLTADLAARVTRGSAMPGDTPPAGPPAGVLFLNAEDSPARTLLPRLQAAGADVSKVFFLEAIREDAMDRPVGLPGDLDLIAAFVREHDIGLLVIDPLMAYLEGRVNAHKDQDVRRALYPLKQLAERTDCAAVIVRHLTKQTSGAGLYRGGGSIGIVGAARAALILGRDPGDDARRIVAMTKSNLGPVPESLAFTLEDSDDENAEGVAHVVWAGPSPLSATEVLATSGQAAAPGASRTEESAKAIRAFLARGPRPVKDLEEHLKAQGFRGWSIKEGRKRAGVEVQHVGSGSGGHWEAAIPKLSPAELVEALLATPKLQF